MPDKSVQTNVVVTLRVAGIHCWPSARDSVSFLRSPHRHLFHIRATKSVVHADRQIEVLGLQNSISDWVESKKNGTTDLVDFGADSCEMIAAELLEKFDLCYCSVMEDGENGAEVFCQ